jgi:hypothetical protein
VADLERTWVEQLLHHHCHANDLLVSFLLALYENVQQGAPTFSAPSFAPPLRNKPNDIFKNINNFE